MTTIAFIGLGNMGGHMARNLVAAGHEVLGHDLSEAACATATENGIRVVGTVKELVVDADVVITMLPTGAHVRDVLVGEDGVGEHARPGTLLVDSSTIDIPTTQDLHQQLSERGFSFVDAPVSGGVGKAAAGTLTFMVGGHREAFDLAEPFLLAMGDTIVHAGGSAAGQAAKICNNMLFGAAITAVSEAFILGEKLGLDPRTLFDVLGSSSGDTWAMRNFCPVPGLVPNSAADEDYAPRFAAALMSKDLKLALGAAEHVGVDLPVSTRANEVFAEYADTHGDRDTSGVIRHLRSRA